MLSVKGRTVNSRNYSWVDQVCLHIDQTIRVLTQHPKATGKENPGQRVEESVLSEEQRQHAASLMRVNHAGEICAQALYHGQGIVSHTSFIQQKMQRAAMEEGDHLRWCQERLEEFHSHASYLTPVWYFASLTIGMVAGLVGDSWSLGFVAETERQVVKHLAKQRQLLPDEDKRSQAILQQMEEDEVKHRDEAIANGARELPDFIKKLMSLSARIMVKTAYYI